MPLFNWFRRDRGVAPRAATLENPVRVDVQQPNRWEPAVSRTTFHIKGTNVLGADPGWLGGNPNLIPLVNQDNRLRTDYYLLDGTLAISVETIREGRFV